MSAPTASYSDAPEVVPPSDLEHLSSTPYDPAQKIPVQATEHDPYHGKTSHDGFMGAQGGYGAAESGQTSVPRPWWRRKKIIIPIAVAALLAVGLGVGLGVGLTMGSDKDDDPQGSSDGSNGGSSSGSNGDSGSGESKDVDAPSCDLQEGLCPRILSTTIHEGTLYVFARTKDDSISYRGHNGTSWDKEFTDLGKPSGSGRIISQPSSGSWIVRDKFPRLDLYVITSKDRRVYGKHFSEAEGWKVDWKAEGPNAGSAIQFCRKELNRMDLWSTFWDTKEISHTTWYQKPDDEISEEGMTGGITTENGWVYADNGEWEKNDALGPAKFGPGVVCRRTDTYHDVVWYDANRDQMLHSSFSDNGGWTPGQGFKGKFIGEPTLVSFDHDEWHFFGAQEDHKLYHLSRNAGQGGYSSLESLGGSILSSPGVTGLGDDESGAMDVVALGTNGRLQHLHYDGTSWASEWEDLDIEAYSAPALDRHADKLFVTALTKDGKLFSLTRDAKAEEKWKGTLKREDLGGDLTLEFVTHDM